MQMLFIHPCWLITLLLPLAALAALRLRPPPQTVVPSADLLPPEVVPPWHWTKWPASLVIAALFLLALAAAGPVLTIPSPRPETRQTAIILCLDVSHSMDACDWPEQHPRPDAVNAANLPPNRLATAKNMIRQLLGQHRRNPIALVAFARIPYLICPLMQQHAILQQRLLDLNTNSFEDGTALADAVLGALHALPDDHRQQAAIILLSDGSDHARSALTPEQAASQAQKLGVPIYAIGIGGQHGLHPVVTDTGELRWEPIAEQLDEQQLRQLAELSGGRYFAARDAAMSDEITAFLNQPLPVTGTQHRQHISLTPWSMLGAVILLALAVAIEWIATPRLRPQPAPAQPAPIQ